MKTPTPSRTASPRAALSLELGTKHKLLAGTRWMVLVAGAAGWLGIEPNSAQAATAVGNMAVSAIVVGTCTVSASAMAFGTYLLASASSTTSTITATCTTGSAYTISLGVGTASGATVTTRGMTVGGTGTILAYSIWQQTGHTSNWGQTPGTDTPASIIGTGATQTVTAYGLIAAGLSVPVGAYTDTIVATITY